MRDFVKVSSDMFDHPKILAVGPLAAWLYAASIGYCNRQLTDGFVPAAVVRKLADYSEIEYGWPGLVEELTARLVRYQLWEVADGGYRVHDYLDYQQSKEHILELQDIRREYGRRGGKQKASKMLATNLPSNLLPVTGAKAGATPILGVDRATPPDPGPLNGKQFATADPLANSQAFATSKSLAEQEQEQEQEQEHRARARDEDHLPRAPVRAPIGSIVVPRGGDIAPNDSRQRQWWTDELGLRAQREKIPVAELTALVDVDDETARWEDTLGHKPPWRNWMRRALDFAIRDWRAGIRGGVTHGPSPTAQRDAGADLDAAAGAAAARKRAAAQLVSVLNGAIPGAERLPPGGAGPSGLPALPGERGEGRPG